MNLLQLQTITHCKYKQKGNPTPFNKWSQTIAKNVQKWKTVSSPPRFHVFIIYIACGVLINLGKGVGEQEKEPVKEGRVGGREEKKRKEGVGES